MRDFFTVLIGKTVRALAKLRGGGSAFPGLVIEKVDPGFLARALDRLPLGVVVVSGTNGKTTTSKIVVELLESTGLRVFTNSTGSNFSRGVIAALLQRVNLKGETDADIAVLELDEAHAMYFIAQVKPKYTLLLNVLRDQLDRFGEIDTTAKFLSNIAMATTDTLVVNREDPLVRAIGEKVLAEHSSVRVKQFGLSENLLKMFPSDAELHGSDGSPLGSRPSAGDADVILTEVGLQSATFEIAGAPFTTDLKLEGVYNTFNAAAALVLVRQVCGSEVETPALIDALSYVKPAFGRGERIELDGLPLELVLVKNPAGFRLALESFEPEGFATMIAINDNSADGRDISWLWDVSFESLATFGVDTVTGIRAWDMALRLEHDGVAFRAVIEPLDTALNEFRAHSQGLPRRIYCTYTAMLELRKLIAKQTKVENVW